MPVYNHTYGAWAGTRRGPFFRWVAIPKFAYMEFFSRRAFMVIFTIGWFQFVARLAYVYLRSNRGMLELVRIPAGQLPPVGAFFFKNMIDVQLPICFVLAVLLGSRLISRDLQHGAIALYMSKPISRWEYLIGKFSVLFGMFMLLTWFQATLLFVIQVSAVSAQDEWRTLFWSQYAWILGAIFLYSALLSTGLALLILAASSLTRHSQFASILFAVYIIGGVMAAGVLHEALPESSAWIAVSPLHVGSALGHHVFRLTSLAGSREPMSPALAWGAFGANCALGLLILRWRVWEAAKHGR